MKNLLTILLILLPFSAHAWGVVPTSGGVAAGGVSWGDAPPSKNVWYSCSPFGTGDIKTGSPTIKIETGGKATLSVAQTGNIGQGDRVTYNTSSVAYIAKVVDSSHFYLVTATGGTPSNVSEQTVNSIAHEYASLSAAEAGASDANHVNNTDLTAADVVLNITCYYDHDDYTADTAAVQFSGYTDDATRYIHVYTPTGGTQSINNQRHSGVYSATKYRMMTTAYCGDFISIIQFYTRLTGIQAVRCTADNSARFLIGSKYAPTASSIIIDSCIVLRTTGDYQYGIALNVASNANQNAPFNIRNCVVSGSFHTGIIGGTYCSAGIYNCLISGCNVGVNASSSNTSIVNSAVFNNTDDFSGTPTVTYTASDDNDVAGTGNVNISPGATETTDWNAAFTDYANGDFSVKDTNSVLYGAGIIQTGVTTDIIGTSRGSVGGACDIGAFEYVSE